MIRLPRFNLSVPGRAAAGLLLASFVSAAPAEALEGKVAAFTAPGSPWANQWQRYRDYVNENAPEIDLQYFISGELGNEDEMLRRLRRNQVQISGQSLQGLSTLVPEINVPMMPYLFESQAEVDFIYDNYLFEPFEALFAEKRLKLLKWVEVGWSHIYANEAVLAPADMEKLKLRGAPNIATQSFLRVLEADSVPLGTVDIVPSLQTGLITGGVSSVPFFYFSLREYASDFTLTRHSYDTGAIVANLRWFEDASAEQQEILTDAFGSSETAREEVRSLVTGLIASMREEGIAVHELTPEARAAWVEASAPAVERILAEVGGRGQEIYDLILKGKAAFAMLEAEADDAAEAGAAARPETPTGP